MNAPLHKRAHGSSESQTPYPMLAKTLITGNDVAVWTTKRAAVHQPVQDRADLRHIPQILAPILNNTVGSRHHGSSQFVARVNNGLQYWCQVL